MHRAATDLRDNVPMGSDSSFEGLSSTMPGETRPPLDPGERDAAVFQKNQPKPRPARIDAKARAGALQLGYVQRLAMKKIALEEKTRRELYGVGRKTLDKLTERGLLERLQNGAEPSFRLTPAGVIIYNALNELGWFPP